MTNDDDEARRIILARRARFVAAALAGAGIASASCESSPQPCLEPGAPGGQYNAEPAAAGEAPSDAGTDVQIPDAALPLPCLTPQAPEGANGSGQGP